MPGVPFGVPALDGPLGPVAPGGTLLLENAPEVESLPWLLQAASVHLGAGRPVVFLATTRTPERIRAGMAAHGFATQGAGGLWFIDAHSGLSGHRSDGARPVADPLDMEQVLEAIADEGRRRPGAVLLIESLDSLLERFGPEATVARRDRWREAMQGYTFAAAAATHWGTETVGRPLFDAVVRLRPVEDRVVLNQVFAVERTPWNTRRQPPCLYKVGRPGGILAYIPKIVVVGPDDAGKSTLVHAVSDGAVSVDRMGTTVALDRGTMVREGVRTDVFGTPGQERFDALLPVLARHASGAVLVIDATRPDTFPRAAQMLRLVWRQGLSTVVALNKQDLPGALGPDEAAGRLDVPDGVTVLACVATDQASASTVVQALSERILGGA